MFFHLVGGRCFSFGQWSVFFIWSVVYHSVGGRLCVWSVVGGFYGWCDRWSVSISVGGRCFMFLMVGGWLFFQQWSVVGVLSSIWSVVGGTRSVVGGRWSVAGQWFCTTPPGQGEIHVNSYRLQTMHRGKVDPRVSELPRGNELSRDHVNRP